jgi:antitoxin (DNA-binding transcriptional repressor) of toxin-antitoxin stability system
MKQKYTVTEAKAQLSKLLAQVERGEVISIARGRTVMGRLVPAQLPRVLPPRELGGWQGQVWEAPYCWDDGAQMVDLFERSDEVELAAKSPAIYEKFSGEIPEASPGQ